MIRKGTGLVNWMYVPIQFKHVKELNEDQYFVSENDILDFMTISKTVTEETIRAYKKTKAQSNGRRLKRRLDYSSMLS